jgi:hypothetical protein
MLLLLVLLLRLDEGTKNANVLSMTEVTITITQRSIMFDFFDMPWNDRQSNFRERQTERPARLG